MTRKTLYWVAGVAAFALSSAALAALIGIQTQLSFPFVNFGPSTSTTLLSGGTLTSSSSPTTMLLMGPVPTTIQPATGSGQKEIRLEVVLDASCNLIGGPATDDLVLEGKVDIDPLGPGDVKDGILLTGEVTQFGFADGGTTDVFDFRFTVTGGLIAGLFANTDVGVVLTSEGSSFAGDCSATTAGDAKGVLGGIPPLADATGCTPGYWKQKHHFDSWVDFDPDQTVESVFGPLDPSVDSLALKDALKLKGGGLNALMRHAVAALLNASNPDVDYNDYPTPADVIAATQAAVASGDPEPQKDLFEEGNEAGCPLN